MRVIKAGHRFELDHLDGDGKTVLQFVQRAPLHEPMQGLTSQEVLRAVIARVKALDGEVQWSGNVEILYHLRMAIVLHEARALMRHVERHGLAAEDIPVGKDGHFVFAGKGAL